MCLECWILQMLKPPRFYKTHPHFLLKTLQFMYIRIGFDKSHHPTACSLVECECSHAVRLAQCLSAVWTRRREKSL